MKFTNLTTEPLYEAAFAKSEDDVKAWFDEIRVHPTDWTVEGNVVNCTTFHLYGHPEVKSLGVKFGEVKGDFILAHNNLMTLKGCPKEVSGSYEIKGKDIKSLQGGPAKVFKNFVVMGVSATDLKGAPTMVGGDFICTHNPNLKSLKGAPKHVEGDVKIYKNPQIASFDGFPSVIGGTLYIQSGDGEKTGMQVTTLKNLQKHVTSCKKIVISGTIKEDILGLCMIDNLKEIEVTWDGDKTNRALLNRAVDIIRKHMGTRDLNKARECQKELIDADLDDFAGM